MQAFHVVAPIVLLLALGVAFRRSGFLNTADVQCMAKLVYWVASPSLFFRAAMRTELDWATNVNLIVAIYVAVALVALLAFLLGRLGHGKGSSSLPVSILASFRPNSAYIGLPIVKISMGEAAMPLMAVYFAVTGAGYNLISALSGELAKRGDAGWRALLAKALWGILKNPIVTSSLLGLLLAALGIHSMPPSIDKVFVFIGEMAVGLSVLMVGAGLGLDGLGAGFRVLPDCLIRLVLHPAILWGCFVFFPVPMEMGQVAILLTAAPTAATVFVMSEGMGLDSKYAAELVCLTTVLFALTMPLWMKFLGVA